jgi:signal transduction histidine kinase
LLVAAWIVDLLTPQLLIVAILFNGPIALSSLALQSRLTTSLVVAAEIANAAAGYYNGVVAGYHWSAIAVGDRALLAASFVLVGYLSVKTQDYAREAGASAGRMREVATEKSLREAIGTVRQTLNLELVRRAVTRESAGLLGASQAMLILREAAFGAPLIFSYRAGDRDVAVERRALSTEIATLVARASASDDPIVVSQNDPLGRLTLDALAATEALVTTVTADGGAEHVLIETTSAKPFALDAPRTLNAFARQAGMALEQAKLFTELGDRNDENARQKNELGDRSDVIRDIVYALAHDLRTPMAAAHVTMNQALAGSYGDLPERYREVLRTALAANDDQRRIVETLLLVARYEAGEMSKVSEPIAVDELAQRVVAELRPVADVKGVELRVEAGPRPLAISGDPHEIRRALANLLANAIDATPRGGHATVRVTQLRPASVEVVVEDDGYGVPETRRAALFERFGGGQPGTGTGLGLYIVRRIAEKHGGTVSFAAREPRGSRFTMTLPAMQG